MNVNFTSKKKNNCNLKTLSRRCLWIYKLSSMSLFPLIPYYTKKKIHNKGLFFTSCNLTNLGKVVIIQKMLILINVFIKRPNLFNFV